MNCCLQKIPDFIDVNPPVFQAEIDAAAELIDFLRFNCHFTRNLLRNQPISVRPEETLNRLRYRSLEGFVASVTPFNFTAIAGNLAYTPTLMVRYLPYVESHEN